MHQISNKFQQVKFHITEFESLNIGIYLEFEIWCLEFCLTS